MYICSISTKELDSLNLKKLICSHARGFKLRWLKKLKEIAIWKVSLNPVEHLDLYIRVLPTQIQFKICTEKVIAAWFNDIIAGKASDGLHKLQ